MRRCCFAAFVAAALLAAAPFSAAEAQGGHWANEPASVLGVRLGVPLSESQLEECPRTWPRNATGRPCVTTAFRSGSLEVRLLHDSAKLTVPYTAAVDLSNGLVEAVRMTVPAINFNQLLELLTERYGLPAKTSAAPVTTLGGATLSSRSATWRGISVEISALEMPVRVDESVVQFSHLPTARERQARDQGATKDAAGKL